MKEPSDSSIFSFNLNRLFNEGKARGLPLSEAHEFAVLGMTRVENCTNDDWARFHELASKLKK